MVTTLIDKTTLAKKGEVVQRWFLVDATGLVLGRLASDIATILMGKHTPKYTAHVDTGDFVLVTNVEKIKVTGKKLQQESFEYYTYYPGGHRYVSWEHLLEKHPDRLLMLAVRRMLPKNKLARVMLSKLKMYRGTEHPHQAQSPVELDLKNGLGKGMVKLSG
ncbi:MAG: 50S ribosomal protein L13 [Phycisphaerae bacterium]